MVLLMIRTFRGRAEDCNKSGRSRTTMFQRRLRKVMISRVQTALCRARTKATNLHRQQVLKIFLTKDAVTIHEAHTLLSQADQTVSLGMVCRTMKLLCSIGFLMPTRYGEQTWYQLVPMGHQDARMVTARGARTR